jgi:hypothetical protein
MSAIRKHCMVILALAAGSGVSADGMPTQFSELPVWDDGLSEMSYYAATDTIYGEPRDYVRVHLLNRQWMSEVSGVKSMSGASDAVPVFKLNIAEEIPTENYNYRYLTTVFLTRPDLNPFKVAMSSQEWCGTTFKHARWTDAGLTIQSFSYFGGEGDKSWSLPGEAVPFEGLFVLARAAVAGDFEGELTVLAPLRGTHESRPQPAPMRLAVGDDARKLRTPAGRFEVRRVEARGAGRDAWFDIETSAPFRLVAFSAGGVTGKLRHVERRAYWDAGSTSGFHRPNAAP